VPFKFEKLEVWQLALEYSDVIYVVAGQLPKNEDFKLKSQIVRAATSIALNNAEDTTGQTDAEQARFLGLAIRSLLETVACQHLINRRKFLTDPAPLRDAYVRAETLAGKLNTIWKAITPDQNWLRETNSTCMPAEAQNNNDL
jgi:four helix bundle protein